MLKTGISGNQGVITIKPGIQAKAVLTDLFLGEKTLAVNAVALSLFIAAIASIKVALKPVCSIFALQIPWSSMPQKHGITGEWRFAGCGCCGCCQTTLADTPFSVANAVRTPMTAGISTAVPSIVLTLFNIVLVIAHHVA